MAEFLSDSFVYAYHVTSHGLIKVGYGENPKMRLASYSVTYGITADPSSLRVWDFAAGSIASAIEGSIHRALMDAGFTQRFLSSKTNQEAQELFELLGHSYEEALLVVTDTIEITTKALVENLKSKQQSTSTEQAKKRRDEVRQKNDRERQQAIDAKKLRDEALSKTVTAKAMVGWSSQVKPWIDTLERAKALMNTKSALTGFFSFVAGRDTVDELRNREIYPQILSFVEKIFLETRRARAWRLHLIIDFGLGVRLNGIDLQFPGGHYLPDDSLHESPEEESVTEVRLAVQSATGWGGGDAIKLMERDPKAFSRLIAYARQNLSPERASGRTWCRYSSIGKYARAMQSTS